MEKKLDGFSIVLFPANVKPAITSRRKQKLKSGPSSRLEYSIACMLMVLTVPVDEDPTVR